MAGVPSIMRAMFERLVPSLPTGVAVASRAVHAVGMMEGAIAASLAAIDEAFPGVDIGSYPFHRDGAGGVAIVARGTDAALLDEAIGQVREMIGAAGHVVVEGEPPAA